MGLIRILLFVLAGVLAYTLFRRLIGGPSRHRAPNMDDDRIGRLVQDPQCQVYVDSKEAVSRKVRGETHYFCSRECADAYAKVDQREA